MKIIALADSKGCIYNPEGFLFAEVNAYKQQTGSVKGFPGAAAISENDMLELDVTVLIPASLESVITEKNAPDIRARIIAELANGATSPEADSILHNNGVYLIPDLLCNAGGVTVSWFEMVQNAYGYYWKEEVVCRRLKKKMETAFRSMLEAAQTHKVHNRMAAYIVAVDRVAEAMRLRGWF